MRRPSWLRATCSQATCSQATRSQAIRVRNNQGPRRARPHFPRRHLLVAKTLGDHVEVYCSGLRTYVGCEHITKFYIYIYVYVYMYIYIYIVRLSLV